VLDCIKKTSKKTKKYYFMFVLVLNCTQNRYDLIFASYYDYIGRRLN
jgi:hypothetical protein